MNMFEEQIKDIASSEEILTSDAAFSKDGEKKKRKTQQCIYCQNHKKCVPKKSHICPYRDCDCLLCELLRNAQITMRHQQRLWRYQKTRLQQTYGRIQDFNSIQGQLCDMCRNHNEVVLKRNHECPFMKCLCQYCKLTCKRRELMKHLQRVRRSKMTSEINEEEEENLEEALADQDLNTNDNTHESSFGDYSKRKDRISSPVCMDSSQGSNLLSEYKKIVPPSLLLRNSWPPPLIPMEDCQPIFDSYETVNSRCYYFNSPESPPSLCPLSEMDSEEEASDGISNLEHSYLQVHQQLLVSRWPSNN